MTNKPYDVTTIISEEMEKLDYLIPIIKTLNIKWKKNIHIKKEIRSEL
jgi:hypothetical protein